MSAWPSRAAGRPGRRCRPGSWWRRCGAARASVSLRSRGRRPVACATSRHRPTTTNRWPLHQGPQAVTQVGAGGPVLMRVDEPDDGVAPAPAAAFSCDSGRHFIAVLAAPSGSAEPSTPGPLPMLDGLVAVLVRPAPVDVPHARPAARAVDVTDVVGDVRPSPWGETYPHGAPAAAALGGPVAPMSLMSLACPASGGRARASPATESRTARTPPARVSISSSAAQRRSNGLGSH